MKKNDKKSDTKVDVKKKNNNRIIIFSLVIVFLILGFVAVYFSLRKYNDIENVIVKNISFHNIEVSWKNTEKDSNYVVLISSNKFTKEDIDNDIKDDKFDLDYQVIEVSNNNKLNYDKVMSNTDYYVAVVAYKNKDNKRKYYSASEVVVIHSNSLEINEVTDLSVENYSDTNIKLKWSLFGTELKNLDGTDIDISYTLFSVSNDEVVELKNDIKEDNYSIGDLTPFTKYSYKIIVNVTVDGKVVSSSDSNLVEVTTKPLAVSGVTAKSKGTNSITLSWNKYDLSSINNNATVVYSIYGADTRDGEYKLLKENITDNSYTETGLTENKTRYYYVLAYIQIDDEKYESSKSTIVSATTNKKIVVNNSGSNNTSTNNSNINNNTNNNSTGKLTQAEKNAQARVIAKQIANSITGSTDLEKVGKAARAVSAYYYNGVHKESGDDYYTAYGVFIKGESSCAGTTRALGMVLEEMGYSWTHVNEHLWTHQWVKITMDGQVGFADGQVGLVGYGKHPME